MASFDSRPTGPPPGASMYVATVAVMIIAGALIFLSINFGLAFFYAMPVTPADPNMYRKELSEALGEKLDWTSMDEALSKCQAAGCRPYINPAEFKVVPGNIHAFSNRPNSNLLYCNETGKWKFTQTDKFGFGSNAPERFVASDLVLLGDSFGTAACLDNKFSITNSIENGGKTVLNLSIGGHQPLDELATLKEYAPQFKVLVWLFFEGNDFIPAADGEFAVRYLEPDYTQNLKAREREIVELFDALEHDWSVRASLRIQQGALAPRNSFNRLSSDFAWWRDRTFAPTISFLRSFRSAEQIEFDQNMFAATLREGMRTARSKGARRFILVYLPSWERFSWKPSTHPQIAAFDQLRKFVSSISDDAGFEFLDVTPHFSTKDRPSLFPYDTHAHYTEKGYALASEAILQSLRK
jgi:hypothetical protein